MIQWQYYPKSKSVSAFLMETIQVFIDHEQVIGSATNTLSSDQVLAAISIPLQGLGYHVETGKTTLDKIKVPVLYGRNGKLEKSFDADAFHSTLSTVLEVEAGRGVTNYQFLKDLFQACMMTEVDYLIIAVRNQYRLSRDFEKVTTFFDTLYASARLQLPLKGVLIIGY